MTVILFFIYLCFQQRCCFNFVVILGTVVYGAAGFVLHYLEAFVIFHHHFITQNNSTAPQPQK